jgi:hypothetical protein
MIAGDLGFEAIVFGLVALIVWAVIWLYLWK